MSQDPYFIIRWEARIEVSAFLLWPEDPVWASGSLCKMELPWVVETGRLFIHFVHILQHVPCREQHDVLGRGSGQNKPVPALIKLLLYNWLEIEVLFFKGLRSKEGQPSTNT